MDMGAQGRSARKGGRATQSTRIAMTELPFEPLWIYTLQLYRGRTLFGSLHCVNLSNGPKKIFKWKRPIWSMCLIFFFPETPHTIAQPHQSKKISIITQITHFAVSALHLWTAELRNTHSAWFGTLLLWNRCKGLSLLSGHTTAILAAMLCFCRFDALILLLGIANEKHINTLYPPLFPPLLNVHSAPAPILFLPDHQRKQKKKTVLANILALVIATLLFRSMASTSLSMDGVAYPVSATFLTISTQEQLTSRSCSPSPVSNLTSPQVSPVLSSSPPSPQLRQSDDNSNSNHITIMASSANSPQQQSLNPQCLAEQRLRSSFAQHQEYQQQMRKRLSDADHPLHLPSPELAQRHQQQLGLQLEYYRQLQIMHCQRVRDIELLHLQQQQLQQQQPQPVQVVKRFQLAQRMLQMQQIYHAQQIQRIQYLQKLNHLQRQNELEQTPPVEAQAIDSVSEEVIAKLEIDPNTIHIPVRAASRPRLDMQEILGTQGSALPHPSTSGRSRVRELARIKLPSPDQIRTLRHQRLKHQARLRQAAAAKSKAASQARQQPCTTDKIDSHGCDMSLQPTCSEFNTTPTSSKLGTVEEVQLTKQVQATVWTSSTTTVVPRSLADLQYKRQLRHSMALQQHMIQDHTHRYRIFQAFCLLQRAREAQALDELQTQKRRHLQTLAWVEALRQSKELEIPQ